MSDQTPGRTDTLMVRFVIGFTTIYCLAQLVSWAVKGGAA